jgi:uncharacterized membrane protein (UPF0127 family)
MIVNLTRQSTIASFVEKARDPWARMKGLLGRNGLVWGHALVITHCQSIHMFFMKFPIDAVFCDHQDKVVGLCQSLKPYGLSPLFLKAAYVIELPSGSIASSQTQIGDQIQINSDQNK